MLMENTETEAACRPSAEQEGQRPPPCCIRHDVPAVEDWSAEEGKIGEQAYCFVPPLARDCQP